MAAGADVASRVKSRPTTSAGRLPARPPTPVRRPSLVAASRKIDLRTRDGIKLVRKPETWQKESWAFFRSVPPLTFGGSYKGSALSRVRPYPAIVLNPDEPPVALADAAESDEPEASGITPAIAEAAELEFARLSNARGGIPALMSAATVGLTIAGECYLVGWPATSTEEERWGVYSSSAIDVRSGQVTVKERAGGGKGEPLPEEAFLARIWCADPEWPGDPWSNMRSALGAAEEYVIWARVFRAIAKSGANGGILTMPTELDQEAPVRAGDEEGPQDELTELQRSLVDYVTESIESDDTVAAAAPWILDGAAEFLDRVKWINTTRSIDQKVLERLDVLKGEFAHGVDLPPEVIKGMGDLTHWNAWQVSDDTYKAHLEPTGQVFVQGLASAFLRPGLEGDEIDPAVLRRIVVALDPSGLVARPNRAADAKELHAKGVLSDEALLRYLAFADADAPEDEELLRRYALDRGVGGVNLTTAVMNRTITADDPLEVAAEATAGEIGTGEGEPAPPEEGGEPVPATLPAAAQVLPVAWAPPALTAAAADDEDDDDPWLLLGLALARIESRLLDRLTVAASDDASEALRKAGSRLKSQAQGNATTRDRVRDVAPEDVATVLGPELVAAMADPDTLLAGSLERLAGRWDAWVAAAQAQVADQLSRVTDLAPDPAGAKAAIEAFRDAAPAARADGWAEAERQMHRLLGDRLTSNVIDIVEGEGDPASHVPAGLLRDALARAGGGTPGAGPSGSAQHSGPPGLTTGPTVRRLLDALGATVMAWRWDHGMPAHPFKPHQDLDGYEFDRWDDPRLAGPGPWPPVAHLHPGDHRGCQCHVVPVINGKAAADRPADPGAEAAASLRSTIYELGDESLTLPEAFARAQSTPVTRYGLRHGTERTASIERAVDPDTMTPSVETVDLAGMFTTQASVNPHYIVKLYEDPLAAVEYDRALADEFPNYRPEVARAPDGTLVLIDGHHRGIAEAARSGTGRFTANVYDVDPSLTAAAGRDRSHRLYGRAAAAATAARARNGGT